MRFRDRFLRGGAAAVNQYEGSAERPLSECAQNGFSCLRGSIKWLRLFSNGEDL